jgi:hypothetical protein
LKVHRSRSVRRAEVTTDGRNLVSHTGTALLSELADRTGLTRWLSEAMVDCGISWHTHDPGVVLTHLAVAIADGADCLCDIDALRCQSELFGEVASVTTAWRAVKHAPVVVRSGCEAPWDHQSENRSAGRPTSVHWSPGHGARQAENPVAALQVIPRSLLVQPSRRLPGPFTVNAAVAARPRDSR